jgi:hypothetical protein
MTCSVAAPNFLDHNAIADAFLHDDSAAAAATDVDAGTPMAIDHRPAAAVATAISTVSTTNSYVDICTAAAPIAAHAFTAAAFATAHAGASATIAAAHTSASGAAGASRRRCAAATGASTGRRATATGSAGRFGSTTGTTTSPAGRRSSTASTTASSASAACATSPAAAATTRLCDLQRLARVVIAR